MNKRLFQEPPSPDRPSADSLSGNGQGDGLSILLIDDNPAVAGAMEIAFRIAGHRLTTAATPEEALSRLAVARHDAILLDLNFTAGRSDGAEGLAVLARIIADDPSACVIVITAHSGIRIAVAAMQAGARDFVMKPWRNADLLAKVEAAVGRGIRTVTPATPLATDADPAHLLGESAAIERLRALVRRVGPTSASVAVTGPSGAGRTLAALAIHAASADAANAPLRVDLRDATAWSRLDNASGTAILRHPDQLDGIAQARLLDRLLPTLRCIAIADELGTLTPALRRRIATVEVPVPPLAARGADAVLLSRHFARVAADRFGRPPVQLSAAAEAAVAATVWPDEVRGLALAIERAVLLAEGDTIDAAALAARRPAPSTAPSSVPDVASPFDLNDAERLLIEAALREHSHNVTHAAAALGLSRGALYRRMAHHGL